MAQAGLQLILPHRLLSTGDTGMSQCAKHSMGFFLPKTGTDMKLTRMCSLKCPRTLLMGTRSQAGPEGTMMSTIMHGSPGSFTLGVGDAVTDAARI